MKKNRKIKSWKCFLFAYFYLFLSLSRASKIYKNKRQASATNGIESSRKKNAHENKKQTILCVYETFTFHS